MKEITIFTLIVIYNLSVIVGTGYLCVVHNWSEWSFLAAAFFLKNVELKFKDNNKKEVKTNG